MQLLRIDHETKLIYTEPAIESVVELRMSPPSYEDQTVLGYRLRMTPPVPITTYRDGCGNRTEMFTLTMPHRDVLIRTASCVRVHRQSGQDRLAGVGYPSEPNPAIDAMEYLRPSPLIEMTSEVRAFCSSLPEPKGSWLDVVDQFQQAVRNALRYEKTVTTASTVVADALKLGCGVCQDISHLFLALARYWNIPARYVSGYVNQPGELATHAWVQLWAGDRVGWVDYDPTHSLWPQNDHVVTGVGRDFADVPPNRGVWKGSATESISVMVSVQPVDRVPLDLTDAGDVTGWTSTPFVAPGDLAAPARDRLNHQRSRHVYRQQQSQQQQ